MNNALRLSTWRRVIICFVGCGILLFIVVGIALATTTPQVCDKPFVKYYCSKVSYTIQGNNANITSRQFKGAIDGGADKWQIWYIKDWEKVSGNWQWRETWGPGSWRTDLTFSSWFEFVDDNRVRIKDSCVTMKFRYYECIPGECYYWCSGMNAHYMINNSSKEAAPFTCTQ